MTQRGRDKNSRSLERSRRQDLRLQDLEEFAGGGGGTPFGSIDPWTHVVIGSDFSTTNDTDTDATGLAFTPVADTVYLVEAFLLVRTATATVGARPGLSCPSGTTDGAYQITVPNSNTDVAVRADGVLGAATNAASTGLPTTTESYLARITAVVATGGSPSGDIQVTLASETAGVSVTIRAGSFLRYRTITA